MQNKKKISNNYKNFFLQKVRNIRIMTSHTRNIEPIRFMNTMKIACSLIPRPYGESYKRCLESPRCEIDSRKP